MHPPIYLLPTATASGSRRKRQPRNHAAAAQEQRHSHRFGTRRRIGGGEGRRRTRGGRCEGDFRFLSFAFFLNFLLQFSYFKDRRSPCFAITLLTNPKKKAASAPKNERFLFYSSCLLGVLCVCFKKRPSEIHHSAPHRRTAGENSAAEVRRACTEEDQRRPEKRKRRPRKRYLRAFLFSSNMSDFLLGRGLHCF